MPAGARASTAGGRHLGRAAAEAAVGGQQVGGDRICAGGRTHSLCHPGRREPDLPPDWRASPSRPRWPSTPRPRRCKAAGRGRHRLRRRRARLPDAGPHRRGGRRPPAATRRTTATRRPPACPSCARRSPRRRKRDSGVRRARRRRCWSPTAASRPSTTRSPRCSTRATRCILPAPYWTTYPEAITPRRRRAGRGRRPTSRPGFRVTRRAARGGAAPPRTKALLFVLAVATRPARSTRRAEVEAIGRWAVEHGIWVRHRRDLRAPHLRRRTSSRRCPSLVPELADTCVVVNGVAKTYAMTGWRVGWMIGPDRRHQGRHQPAVARHVERRQRLPARPRSPPSPATSTRSPRCAPPSTGAASTMHADAQRHPRRHLPRAAGRVLLLPVVRGRARAAPSAGARPTARSSWPTSCSTEAKVAVVPGEAFGAPGYGRFSFALGDDDLVEGITRLGDAAVLNLPDSARARLGILAGGLVVLILVAAVVAVRPRQRRLPRRAERRGPTPACARGRLHRRRLPTASARGSTCSTSCPPTRTAAWRRR